MQTIQKGIEIRDRNMKSLQGIGVIKTSTESTSIRPKTVWCFWFYSILLCFLGKDKEALSSTKDIGRKVSLCFGKKEKNQKNEKKSINYEASEDQMEYTTRAAGRCFQKTKIKFNIYIKEFSKYFEPSQ